MRILDRYLLREFLIPLMYCLDAFALLWLVADLVGTLDDFIEHEVGGGQVLRYYLIALPEAIVLIVPMALLLGLLFCLANLGKHNEILAMRIGGLSLLRLARPLLGVGLVASALVFVVNVWFVPGAKAHARSLLRSIRGGSQENIVENLFYTDPREPRDWYVRRFDPVTEIFENPEVHERDAAGQPQRDIFAAQAQWEHGAWQFHQVEVYDHQPGGSVAVTRADVRRFPALTENPQQLLAENKQPSEMTVRELRRAIRAQRPAGHTARLGELRVNLHYQYAFPLTCLMVVWFGIPLGINIRRSGALRSVGIALVMVVAFHFGSNIALALGSGNHIPPVLAAWLSNIVFAIIGGGLMWQAR